MQAVSAARLSLFAGLIIFALKAVAWLLTGSVALFSDALESVVNVVAAGVALGALTVAARPADENHAFGHTKAEYLSAVFEGVLVVLAALAIVQQAWGRLWAPTPLPSLELGLGISVLAAVGNGALAWYLVRLGKARRSPALKADGIHLAADVVTTAGVLVGIGLAWATGWWVLDPLLALVVAVNVLVAGFRLVRESLGGLMDEALPAEELARVEAVLSAPREGVLEIHDIKTRRSGPLPFIQFHLIVPGAMPVVEAHRVCDHLEAALVEALPDCQVLIHVEPETEVEHRGIRFRSPRRGKEP